MTSPARSRLERLLLVLTPAAAMTAVGLGLRIGGRGPVRAAVVRGAAPADTGAGLAWQVLVFDEDQGAREAAAGVPLVVTADTGSGARPSWQGVTNEDGAAELQLPVPGPSGFSLEVKSGETMLARGQVSPALPAVAPPLQVGWARFARREGTVALDVTVLGARAAPGSPADLWVRATDSATRGPLAGVSVALDEDASLGIGGGLATPAGTTDSRGWAHLVVEPVGLAVTAALRAEIRQHADNSRRGLWVGGLFMSPGAPRIDLPIRLPPATPIPLTVTTPTIRPLAYLEIDNPRGRAWAAAPPLTPTSEGTARAVVTAPALPPGVYWAVGATDPSSAAGLEPGTIARPFAVAPDDDAALALAAAAGADRDTCSPPRDPREMPSALAACLALTPISAVPRWTALDGFAMQRSLDHEARQRGLLVALGALAVAIALEATLLLRAASGGRGRTVALAVLVGLLGFALLAAFIVRV